MGPESTEMLNLNIPSESIDYRWKEWFNVA